MRATELDKCHTYYREAAEEKDKSEKLLEVKKKQLEEQGEDVKKWEKKRQHWEGMDGKKKKLNDIKTELSWALANKYTAAFEKRQHGFPTIGSKNSFVSRQN